MSHRAYALLTLKSIDDERRCLEGIATSIQPDRLGDIVEPKGARFKLPLPLLWQHNPHEPIGHVLSATVTDQGIAITAQIAKGVTAKIDEAWALIKAGLVRGLSIGFRPDDAEQIPKSSGMRFKTWEWLELSAVTIPAHTDATITLVKQLDAPALAATGEAARPHPPGDTGSRAVVYDRPKVSPMKTYAERIASVEASIAAKTADLETLQTKVSDEGRTKDQTERDQFDALKGDIDGLARELTDLRDMERFNVQKAVPVMATTAAAASASRAPEPSRQITLSETLPKGIGFARAVKCWAVARLDGRNVLEVTKEMYPSDTRLHAHVAHVQALPHLITQIKAAVPAATTTATDWAAALADPTNLASEFIEYLRPATIIGRLNLRSVPFNIRLVEQTGGGTGYWVGQGAPKPLTSFIYAPVTLGPTKVAAIAVATEEAVRYSTPSLDMLIRDGLRDALVERIDIDLIDPAEAGTTNVQPASLTNGLTPIASAGATADHIRTDIAALLGAIRSENLRGPIALVMPDHLALGASLLSNGLGQAEFPDLTAEGGTIRGIRVITSQYLAQISGAGNMVVAIAEREVFLADDGAVTVDVSREASLQMADDPTNSSATPTATSMVSMWQTNSVAFRAERYIHWKKRRAEAVAYMDDVNWASVGSP